MSVETDIASRFRLDVVPGVGFVALVDGERVSDAERYAVAAACLGYAALATRYADGSRHQVACLELVREGRAMLATIMPPTAAALSARQIHGRQTRKG